MASASSLSLALVFASVVSGPGSPLTAKLAVGTMEGAGWRAEGVAVRMHLAADRGVDLSGSLDIARLSLPDREIRDIRLDCAELRLAGGRIRCLRGRASLPLEELDAPGFELELGLGLDGSALDLRLRDVAVAGGRADVRYTATPEGPRLDLTMESLSLSALAAHAGERLPEAVRALVGLDGRVSGRVRANFTDGLTEAGSEDVGALRLTALAGTVAVADLAVSDAAGELATDGLALAADLDLAISPRGWHGPVALRADAGEFYAQPEGLSGAVYLSLSERPLSLAGELSVDADGFALEAMRLVHGPVEDLTPGSVLHAEGRLVWSDGVPDLSLSRFAAVLPAAYQTWLQPFFYGTPAGELETRGRVRGSVAVVGGALQRLDAELEAVALEAPAWAVQDLAGRLAWRAQGSDDGDGADVPETSLSWETGRLSKVPIGGGSVRLRLAGERMELLAPVRVPLLDGAIRIDELALGLEEGAGPSARLHAELEPLSLRALTEHLDLPPFGGSVSGSLPGLSYEEGVLAVTGELHIRAFEGDVRVRGLRVRDPFGVLPRARADIEIRGLDLGRLTETFAFGSITGRLDGDVRGLRTVGLEPVAFDASLQTPEGDRSRRRISQRAVQNISRIGGGAGAALSTGLVSFFDTFRYQRLGWRCRLEAEVCHMGGVAPHPRGYYLVEGAGLPRIDIIGDQERVDWPVLVGRIQRAIQGRGPTIGDGAD